MEKFYESAKKDTDRFGFEGDVHRLIHSQEGNAGLQVLCDYLYDAKIVTSRVVCDMPIQEYLGPYSYYKHNGD